MNTNFILRNLDFLTDDDAFVYLFLLANECNIEHTCWTIVDMFWMEVQVSTARLQLQKLLVHTSNSKVLVRTENDPCRICYVKMARNDKISHQQPSQPKIFPELSYFKKFFTNHKILGSSDYPHTPPWNFTNLSIGKI